MEKITLQLTVNELNGILGALAKQPFEAVHLLIANISQQAQGQMQASQNPNLGNVKVIKE